MSRTLPRQIVINVDQFYRWSVSIDGVPQTNLRRFAIDLDDSSGREPYYTLEHFLYTPPPDSTISQGEGTTMK
jgi:hypothetical protein